VQAAVAATSKLAVTKAVVPVRRFLMVRASLSDQDAGSFSGFI
jgi:hypothetical protein